MKRCISFRTFRKRISGLWRESAWNNLEELLEFDREHGVRSTFFVAVSRGRGISYSLDQARRAIRLIRRKGFDVGVHGIAYDDVKKMREEHKVFREISGLNNFGSRIHYLKMGKHSLDHLSKIGYLFDSTEFSTELKQPYRYGNILEIPLHIMDTYLFSPFYKGYSLEQAIDYTKGTIKNAGNKIVNILLHQRHFSDEFPKYKKWYKWFVEYCQESSYNFVGYRGLARARAA